MIDVKIEHEKCQQGETTSLGIMFELTAPKAPMVANEKPRTAKALVFVVDRSGSMNYGRLDMVKQTIIDTLPRLNPEDYVSVVSFDDDARSEVSLGQVRGLDMFQVRDKVARLQTGGSTNLEAGYRLALEESNKAPRGVEVNLIVLSDGHANQGITDPLELGAVAARGIEHYITTSTIGIGDGYDERILDALAERGNGNHIAAIEQAEAMNALQAEIDDFLQKTMTDVRFEINLGPELSGRRSRIKAARPMRKFEARHGSARALIGDLASGEEKNVVFDLAVEVHELAHPGWYRGFVVKYEYFDVLSGKTVTETRDYKIEVVAKENWIEPQRNEDIVAELKTVRLQAVRDGAIDLYRQGREAEADELLKRAGLELDDYLRNAAHMSDRNRNRLYSQSSEFQSFAQMRSINEKSKRMYESRRRVDRDKRDFRDKP